MPSSWRGSILFINIVPVIYASVNMAFWRPLKDLKNQHDKTFLCISSGEQKNMVKMSKELMKFSVQNAQIKFTITQCNEH